MAIRVIGQIVINSAGSSYIVNGSYFDSDSGRNNIVTVEVPEQPDVNTATYSTLLWQAFIDAVNADNNTPNKATVADIMRPL